MVFCPEHGRWFVSGDTGAGITYCPGCGGDRVELLTAEANKDVIGYRGVGPGRVAPIFCVDCGSGVNRAVEPIFRADISETRPPVCRSCDAPVLVDDDNLGEESRESLIKLIAKEVDVDHPGAHQLRAVTLTQISRRFGLEGRGTVDSLREQLRGYFGWDRDSSPIRKPELVQIIRTLRTQDTSDSDTSSSSKHTSELQNFIHEYVTGVGVNAHNISSEFDSLADLKSDVENGCSRLRMVSGVGEKSIDLIKIGFQEVGDVEH